MDVALTLERRRGEEAVLRDARGRRFVLPGELVPNGAVTVAVADAVRREPGDPAAAGRTFLTRLLSRA